MAYVRTRLGRWFYEERGRSKRPDDAAILLFHSLLVDGGMWRGQVGPLAELGRVLNFDGPGHGRSDVPPVFTLEDHAAALADVFSELGVDRAILVGLSWGAMIGMRAALSYPDRVRALALFDTSAEVVPRADKIKYRLMISLSRRFGVPLALVRSELATRMFSPRTLREKPELVVEFSRTLNGYPREGTARASLAVAIRRKDIVASLGAIKAPTLVVCGREDRATPPSNSETIAAHIPGARLEWIEDAGHLSALERPQAANSLLLPFVAANL
jgi:3-oxoadipate enol-lactonase